MRKYDRPVLQSAERTLKVIQLLVQRGALSLTEVARELDISPSMAHRLLTTCCATGFARQDAPSGAYTAGPALQEIALGASGAATLRESGAATLARAQKALGETVSVVVLEGRAVRFVETLEGDGLVRVAAPLGRTLAAHATAAGRALLACLPEEELERRYPTRTLPRAPRSRVRTWADLSEELEATRARGWAVQAGESDSELLAVAFAVVDGLGAPRAALCAAVPLSRYAEPDAVGELAEALRPFARSMQRRLRGSR